MDPRDFTLLGACPVYLIGNGPVNYAFYRVDDLTRFRLFTPIQLIHEHLQAEL